MTNAELIAELQRHPAHLPARVYLDPGMFPDEVDLNELPGWYRVRLVEIGNIQNAKSGGNVVQLFLED
jgi:hypothetical protein